MMKKWLITMRIWSLTATIVPIALGGVLAWQAESFSWPLFALILLCGALLQIATNLFNTYGDVKAGVDKDKMALLLLSLSVIHRAAWVVFALALALAAWIVICSTYALLWFALAGALGVACYTGKFFKYAGLGVPGVFFLMGPLEVGATYLALTQSLMLTPFLFALPIACHVAAILHANDLRDMAGDRASGIRTFALVIGEVAAKDLYMMLMLVPYVLTLFIGYFCCSSSWAMAGVWLTFPLALGLVRNAYQNMHVETLEPRSAGLHFLFGILFVMGFAFGH